MVMINTVSVLALIFQFPKRPITVKFSDRTFEYLSICYNKILFVCPNNGLQAKNK